MNQSLIDSRRIGTTIVIDLLESQLVDQIELEQIKQDIRDAISGEASPQVVIDFDRVEHCASSMISVLIELRAQIESDGGHLLLAGVSPELRDLFRIVRLDKMFSLHDSTREALEALHQGD